MLRLSHQEHTLNFKFLAGTSRGTMSSHKIAYLQLQDSEGNVGFGEIAPIEKLSVELLNDSLQQIVELEKLSFADVETLLNLLQTKNNFTSSLKFALETAIEDLSNGGQYQPFLKNHETKPVKINGLVWMNTAEAMKKQAREKAEQGFECIKLKVGALDLEAEESVLEFVRSSFPNLTLRIDANGAWNINQALAILKRWEKYNIHSVEQPIYTQNLQELKTLCAIAAIPVAFDEQLIGSFSLDEKITLLETAKPKFLVLKPGLIGGFAQTKEWISLANERNIEWWLTSALESNVGLNAIYRFCQQHIMPNQIHGLGTGNLYHNNWESPLEIKNGHLSFNPSKTWGETPFS